MRADLASTDGHAGCRLVLISPCCRSVASAAAIAAGVIVPALSEFYRSYPEVELDVGNKHTDLVSDGIDCAIRPGEVSEQMMVARRIGEFHFVTCATPDFLQRHGMPRTPADLSTRPSIGMIYASSGRALPFQFSDGATETEPALSHRLVVSDTNSYLAAGLAGLGIIQAPSYAVHEAVSAGKLVALLKDWRTPTIPVHVIYAPNRYLSAKVRVFIDWAVTLFERHEDLRRS